MTTAPSLKSLRFTGPEPMRASDRPRTLYAGTGTLNELVGVAVRASLAFARVSGGWARHPGHFSRTYMDGRLWKSGPGECAPIPST
jgi:hypothetical protein